MTSFSADWLALREPADRGARPRQLLDWLRPSLRAVGPLRILDLATGTGSNLRYLVPRIGGTQQWTLADHDQELLDAIPSRLGAWARQQSFELRGDASGLRLQGAALECRIERVRVDLASHLESIDFRNFDLVTTAAFLDLVSAPWLQDLVRRCAESGCAVLFALSYDGRTEFTPSEAEDALVLKLVNRHQHTDKGFGPALGPDSAPRCVEFLRDLGYDVRTESSDWHIDASQPQLQQGLLAGWAGAAAVMASAEAARIRDWCDRRLAYVEGGRSQLKVGHLDVAARLR